MNRDVMVILQLGMAREEEGPAGLMVEDQEEGPVIRRMGLASLWKRFCPGRGLLFLLLFLEKKRIEPSAKAARTVAGPNKVQ